MIRILVIDGCYLIRMGLMSLLSGISDFELIAGACNGQEAIQIAREASLDIALTDLCLPDMEGSELVQHLLLHCPHIKIVALAAHFDRYSLDCFLEAGGQGYLTRDASLERLAYAIRTIMQGQRYLDAGVDRSLKVSSLATTRSGFDSLSRHEVEILRMITQGMMVPEIAKALRLTHKIVNFYRYQLYQKLYVQNDVELAMAGIQMGILEQSFATKSPKSATILPFPLVHKTRAVE